MVTKRWKPSSINWEVLEDAPDDDVNFLCLSTRQIVFMLSALQSYEWRTRWDNLPQSVDPGSLVADMVSRAYNPDCECVVLERLSGYTTRQEIPASAAVSTFEACGFQVDNDIQPTEVSVMSVEVGAFMPYPSILPPSSGWLPLVNPAEYFQDDYPELFDYLNSIGDTELWQIIPPADPLLPFKFRLGSMDNHVIAGAGNVIPYAQKSGADRHTLSVDEMPEHQHKPFADQGDLWYIRDNGNGNRGDLPPGNNWRGSNFTSPTGGGQSHNNRQLTVGLYWHIRALPPVKVVEVKGEKGDKGDQGERGLPGEVGPPGEKGEQGLRGVQGAAGVCTDPCEPEPEVVYPDNPPPYNPGEEPPSPRCSAATRMRNVLQEQVNILYVEALDAGTITLFILAAVSLVITGFFTGIGVAILTALFEIAKNNVVFDDAFWDEVKCEAFCVLPPNGLFDENVVNNLIEALEARSGEPQGARFTVVAGFIRALKINGINYTERVDPISDADCSDCDCGGAWVVFINGGDLTEAGFTLVAGTEVGSGSGSYLDAQNVGSWDYNALFTFDQPVTISGVRLRHQGSSQTAGTEVSVSAAQPFTFIIQANFQPVLMPVTINQDIDPPRTFSQQIRVAGNWINPDARLFWIEIRGEGYLPPEWVPYS